MPTSIRADENKCKDFFGMNRARQTSMFPLTLCLQYRTREVAQSRTATSSTLSGLLPSFIMTSDSHSTSLHNLHLSRPTSPDLLCISEPRRVQTDCARSPVISVQILTFRALDPSKSHHPSASSPAVRKRPQPWQERETMTFWYARCAK